MRIKGVLWGVVLPLLTHTTPTLHAHDPPTTHHDRPESVEDQAAVLKVMRDQCEARMEEEMLEVGDGRPEGGGDERRGGGDEGRGVEEDIVGFAAEGKSETKIEYLNGLPKSHWSKENGKRGYTERGKSILKTARVSKREDQGKNSTYWSFGIDNDKTRTKVNPLMLGYGTRVKVYRTVRSISEFSDEKFWINDDDDDDDDGDKSGITGDNTVGVATDKREMTERGKPMKENVVLKNTEKGNTTTENGTHTATKQQLLTVGKRTERESEHNNQEKRGKLLTSSEIGLRVRRDNEDTTTTTTTTTINYCPTTFDNVYCWPRAPPDTLVTVPCPTYVQGFQKGGKASRYCTAEGSWFKLEGSNTTWTNYTQCSTTLLLDEVNQTLDKWVRVVRVVSHVGYGVSLVTLLVAFTVLASFKRLRCPRNTLHMHLFLSFICRALAALARGSEAHHLTTTTFTTSSHHQLQGGTWGCRLFTGLWQYFILANYAWILMEGLYLHNLIFLALFTDNSAITLYIVLGWGIPLVLVAGWAGARVGAENTLCWFTHNKPWIFWTFIRGPVSVSILVSFALFLNIARELLLKLRSSTTTESRRYTYRRWARSTLVLVPLFGVHYAALLGFTYYLGKNHTIEIIWLFTDQFFASFQGFFVATLYCLLNAEVRSELQKIWQHWRQSKGPHHHHHHSLFHSHCHSSRSCFSKGGTGMLRPYPVWGRGGGGGGGSNKKAATRREQQEGIREEEERENGSPAQVTCLSLLDKSLEEQTTHNSITTGLALVEMQPLRHSTTSITTTTTNSNNILHHQNHPLPHPSLSPQVQPLSLTYSTTTTTTTTDAGLTPSASLHQHQSSPQVSHQRPPDQHYKHHYKQQLYSESEVVLRPVSGNTYNSSNVYNNVLTATHSHDTHTYTSPHTSAATHATNPTQALTHTNTSSHYLRHPYPHSPPTHTSAVTHTSSASQQQHTGNKRQQRMMFDTRENEDSTPTDPQQYTHDTSETSSERILNTRREGIDDMGSEAAKLPLQPNILYHPGESCEGSPLLPHTHKSVLSPYITETSF